MIDLSLREQIVLIICGNRVVDNWNVIDVDYELVDVIFELFKGVVKFLEWGWVCEYGMIC